MEKRNLTNQNSEENESIKRAFSCGIDVWIFGIIERRSNRIIMYPVKKRNRQTLLPLIKKHVSAGSRIYCDGWKAYITLNDEGYDHYISGT